MAGAAATAGERRGMAASCDCTAGALLQQHADDVRNDPTRSSVLLGSRDRGGSSAAVSLERARLRSAFVAERAPSGGASGAWTLSEASAALRRAVDERAGKEQPLTRRKLEDIIRAYRSEALKRRRVASNSEGEAGPPAVAMAPAAAAAVNRAPATSSAPACSAPAPAPGPSRIRPAPPVQPAAPAAAASSRSSSGPAQLLASSQAPPPAEPVLATEEEPLPSLQRPVPSEIFQAILSHLPGIWLVRARAVCVAWRAAADEALRRFVAELDCEAWYRDRWWLGEPTITDPVSPRPPPETTVQLPMSLAELAGELEDVDLSMCESVNDTAQAMAHHRRVLVDFVRVATYDAVTDMVKLVPLLLRSQVVEALAFRGTKDLYFRSDGAFCPRLKRLVIDECNPYRSFEDPPDQDSRFGAAIAASCKNLEVLHITNHSRESFNGINMILASCKRLRKLVLLRDVFGEDSATRTIELHSNSLQELWLSDPVGASLSARLPNLLSLNVEMGEAFANSAAPFLRSAPSLRSFCLWGSVSVTGYPRSQGDKLDGVLEAAASYCRRLEVVSLWRSACGPRLEPALQQLRAANPAIRIRRKYIQRYDQIVPIVV
eukprot:tig00000254_g22579.t1